MVRAGQCWANLRQLKGQSYVKLEKKGKENIIWARKVNKNPSLAHTIMAQNTRERHGVEVGDDGHGTGRGVNVDRMMVTARTMSRVGRGHAADRQDELGRSFALLAKEMVRCAVGQSCTLGSRPKICNAGRPCAARYIGMLN